MIDVRASVARLCGHPITEEMAKDIVASQVELEQLRAENALLRAVYLRDAPNGLTRRPPGRDR